MSYDTSKPEGLRAAAGVRQGLARVARHRRRRARLRRAAGRPGRRRAAHDGADGHPPRPPRRRPGARGAVQAARRGRPADRPRRLRHEGRARGDDVRAVRRGRPGPRCACASSACPTRSPRTSTHRSTDALVAEGLRGRLRHHRRADRPPHRRPGQGRARGPRRGPGHRARTARRRGSGDNAILKAHDAFRRIETLPFSRESSDLFDRPSINLARIDGRRRLQQGPRRLHDGRRHPLPAQPGPRRRSSPRSARSATSRSSRASSARRRSSRAATPTCSRCATRSGARSRATR